MPPHWWRPLTKHIGVSADHPAGDHSTVLPIEATNNRHMLETGASMFTDGDLACARAIREQIETGHGPAFSMLPYFWCSCCGR
jgi:hypothetical protein